MRLIQKAYAAKAEALGERQVRVIVSTADVDRSGETIIPEGVSWKAYMATGAGPVLWNHNANMPVAKCVSIERQSGQIVALVEFPPEGDDADSDRVYKRVKFGSVPGVSIGFQPLSSEPLDKANPVKGPQRYLSSEMMEFSFTPIPCNPAALVVDKAAKSENWKVGASRNLPLDEEADWDDDAAAAGIFDACDFDSDSPDTTAARKGFLVYDASASDMKSSYKLPFAQMVDGKLTAIAGGIRAAASRLPQTEIPDDAATKAQAVIDHYEAKMKQKSTRAAVIKAGQPIKIKSLYHVARLAGILGDLDWLKDCMEWDALYSGDEAQLPNALGEALQALGAALVSMTSAEVAALLDGGADDAADLVEKGIITASASTMVKAIAVAHVKSGRKFSVASINTMQDACKAIKDGHDAIASLMEDADTTDTGGSEKNAVADRAKALSAVQVKRLRVLDVLRLSQPL